MSSDPLTPELEGLFSSACDEQLTAEDMAALERALTDDEQLQTQFLAFCQLHAQFRHEVCVLWLTLKRSATKAERSFLRKPIRFVAT